MITFSMICILVALTTLWCVGVHINGRYKDDVFYFLNRISREWLLAKPVYHCVNCMASIHSIIVMAAYFYIAGVHIIWSWEMVGRVVILWIIVTVISSATNGIVYLLHECLENYLYQSNKSNESTDESA